MKTLLVTALAICFAGTINAQEKTNSPKTEYKSGSSKVTVWENEKTGKHGDYSELSFKVEKVYKKDDKWESTNYFNLEELMELKAAIDKAILEEGVEVKD
jgi:hypothetical protein